MKLCHKDKITFIGSSLVGDQATNYLELSLQKIPRSW